MKKFNVLPKSVIMTFFLMGLTSAFAFRLIIVAQHFNEEYVRVIWYLAVILNLAFFFFRYHISQKRKRAVSEHTLIEKLTEKKELKEEERESLIYLLTSIEQSRENLNYMCIFIFSALAILTDIILSLLK